jgi:hypothetical protein
MLFHLMYHLIFFKSDKHKQKCGGNLSFNFDLKFISFFAVTCDRALLAGSNIALTASFTQSSSTQLREVLLSQPGAWRPLSDDLSQFIQVCDAIVYAVLIRPFHTYSFLFNPFIASCENAMFSVPGVPAPCEKFPQSSQLNFE